MLIPLHGFHLHAPSEEIQRRRGRLEEWNKLIQAYNESFNQIPTDLFEAKNKATGHYVASMVHVNILEDDWQHYSEVKNDRDKFLNYVQYDLSVSHDGWYVIEKQPGKLYKKRLMIDHEGNIYVIKAKK